MLPGFSAATRSADVVEGNGAGAEEDKGESQGGQPEREFGCAGAHQSVVDVDFGDGDAKVYADGKGGNASEQAQQDEQASKEFGEGGEVGGPGGEPEAGHKLSMRSEEHTSELQSPDHLVCRLLLEKKKTRTTERTT